jgi:hypothetical protein
VFYDIFIVNEHYGLSQHNSGHAQYLAESRD